MRRFRLGEKASWPECEIRIEGELDRAVTAQLKLVLDRAVAMGHPVVIVDLEQCEFIDAGGLEVLRAAQAQLVDAGREMVLLGASEQVRRIFELTDLFQPEPPQGRTAPPASSEEIEQRSAWVTAGRPQVSPQLRERGAAS